MNGTYTSPNLSPNIVGLGEYSDRDLLAELVNRGVIDKYKDKLLATNSGIIDINGRRVDNMVSHEQIKEVFGE